MVSISLNNKKRSLNKLTNLESVIKRVTYKTTNGAVTNPLNDLLINSPINAKTGKLRGNDIVVVYELSLAQIVNGDSTDLMFPCKVECTCYDVMNGKTNSLTECSICKGEGTVNGKRKLNLTIREGTKAGDIMKFTSLGEAGAKGAITGDLYIKFIYNTHEFYTISQNNVCCRIPISSDSLLAGGRITITLPSKDKTMLKILPFNNHYNETKYPNLGLYSPVGDMGCLNVKFERTCFNKNLNISTKTISSLHTLTKLLLKQIGK
ncbi:MAG: DnaJ C-terminal domain-containing protein [Candidatus Hodgkinia cicadicola]